MRRLKFRNAVWMAAMLCFVLNLKSEPMHLDTLAGLRDRSRVLLVFAPSSEDVRMEKQLHRLRDHAAEATERDLVTIALPAAGAAASERRMDAVEAAAVRRQFRVEDSDFLVVLVGKDGGEKLRSSKVLSFEQLRAVIDAMPMRQQEMRKP